MWGCVKLKESLFVQQEEEEKPTEINGRKKIDCNKSNYREWGLYYATSWCKKVTEQSSIDFGVGLIAISKALKHFIS